MRRFFLHWFSITVALAAVAWLMPGVHLTSWVALILGGLAIGLANALVRPVLTVFTLPITVLTLGLFYLVVNGASFGLAAWFVRGFSVDSLGAAIVGALLVSVISSFVEWVLRDRSPKKKD